MELVYGYDCCMSAGVQIPQGVTHIYISIYNDKVECRMTLYLNFLLSATHFMLLAMLFHPTPISNIHL